MRESVLPAARAFDDQLGDAILQPGRNCWRINRARHFYAVQDAADYFRLVRRALVSARRSVFILGWDMTAGVDLEPGAPASPVPTRFDRLLRYVARRRPALRCYLLTWDYGALFTLERDPFSRFRFSRRMPRGVHFRFDDRHPVGACHHQKVLVVDDQLAFCGGVDLTGHRWDTSAHLVNEPLRKTPTGKVYGPYHEVQTMVDGPVAASLGELARERWRAVSDEHLPPVEASTESLWPQDVAADLTDVDVAISRTLPAFGGRAAVRECEALFFDAIARATRSIYIENQYFTHVQLTDALAARLAEPNGPEVIIAVPRDSHGWLEHETIGAMRDTAFRRLIAADSFKRLRLVAPVASRAQDVPTFVHSKVMIVDDQFLRIGSANCTHRSMGVDTECDLAVEADGNGRVADGIVRVRDRLIGEHLGLSAEAVSASLARTGSLAALVDEREHADRTLARISLPPEPVGEPTEAVRLAVDPDAPADVGEAVERLVPSVDDAFERRGMRRMLVPVLAAGVGAAAIFLFVRRWPRSRGRRVHPAEFG
jgi:phosphatidylserine/phosphatidylglycerophosphate/cardiolipin synthase-like enzyme